MFFLGTTAWLNAGDNLPPHFRTEVDAVSVRTSVVDDRNRFAIGLQRKHFKVFENNVQQTITHFSPDKAPVSIGIVLDTSGSMKEHFLAVRASVARFLEHSEFIDEFFLVLFSQEVKLAQDFTSRTEEIQNNTSIADPKGRTALYDAVYIAIDKMAGAQNSRKALIVFTDGEDNASRYTFTELRDFIKESDVQIYVIGSQSRLVYGYAVIEELVKSTGGKAFFPKYSKQLDYFCELISLELRHQYLLSYTPTDSTRDGKWRKIKVRLGELPKETSGFHVRAREGYFAR